MEGSVLRLNLWKRIEVPAGQCPRIPAAFLDEERKIQGPSWFRQEYECSFEALEGLVYPDFDRCVVPALPEDLQRFDRDHVVARSPDRVTGSTAGLLFWGTVP